MRLPGLVSTSLRGRHPLPTHLLISTGASERANAPLRATGSREADVAPGVPVSANEAKHQMINVTGHPWLGRQPLAAWLEGSVHSLPSVLTVPLIISGDKCAVSPCPNTTQVPEHFCSVEMGCISKSQNTVLISSRKITGLFCTLFKQTLFQPHISAPALPGVLPPCSGSQWLGRLTKRHLSRSSQN